MKTKKELIEIYRGVEIWSIQNERPFETIQTNVPVLGTMCCGHFTLESAKKYIDSTIK